MRLFGVAVRAVLLRLVGVAVAAAAAAAAAAVAFGVLAAPLAFGVAVADAAFGVAGAPTFLTLTGVLSSATASSRRGEGLRAFIGGGCWRATCSSVSDCRLVMLLFGRPLALGVLGAGIDVDLKSHRPFLIGMLATAAYWSLSQVKSSQVKPSQAKSSQVQISMAAAPAAFGAPAGARDREVKGVKT